MSSLGTYLLRWHKLLAAIEGEIALLLAQKKGASRRELNAMAQKLRAIANEIEHIEEAF